MKKQLDGVIEESQEKVANLTIHKEKKIANTYIEEIKAYCKDQIDHLWEEVKRFENPHRYYVDLSEKLWNSKHELLKSFQG